MSGDMSNMPPSAVLEGHACNVCESNFSLDTSPAKHRARVLSGDREGLILLWNIESGGGRAGAAGGGAAHYVSPIGHFRGHESTVEDVCFHPQSDSEFCSVGDDKR